MILRLAALYLIALGLAGLAWPFASNAIYYPEMATQALSQQLKIYSRELCLALAFIIGGIGIIKKQLWSRKVCLAALALAFFYGGNIISWQWAGGKPPTQILISAYLLSFLLFGVLFLILFRELTAKALDIR